MCGWPPLLHAEVDNTARLHATLQDSAAQLQSATCKAMAIAALRSAGPEGMGLKAVLDAAPGPGGGLLDNCLPRTMQTVGFSAALLPSQGSLMHGIDGEVDMQTQHRETGFSLWQGSLYA